jgi:hypothetical protein
MINKKKLTTIALPMMLAVSLAFTACGSVIPDMDPETEQKVGEYAGLLMLRYDANHRSRLVKIPDELLDPVAPEEPVVEEPVVEEPEPEVPPEPEEQVTVVDVSEEPEVSQEEEILPERFMQLPEGVGLVYEGFDVADSYGDDVESGFTLDASDGMKLVVVHYLIYNQSGEPVTVDFLNDGYSFRATFNNSINRTALVTMLMDDMSTYINTLDNMYGEKLVLLFEVKEDVDISSIVLNIVGYEGSCNVVLE